MTTKQKQKSNSTTTGQLVGVTTAQRKRLPKPREGFLQLAPTLISFYEKNQSEMHIKGKTPESLRAEMTQYQSLLEQEAALREQLRLLQQTCSLRGSNFWVGLLDIYALGKAVGRNDDVLQNSLADFEEFMKTGPRKSKKAAPPATTAPVTTTTSPPLTSTPTPSD